MENSHEIYNVILNNKKINYRTIPLKIDDPKIYFEILRDNVLSEIASELDTNTENNHIYTGTCNRSGIVIIKNISTNICLTHYLIIIDNIKYIIVSDINFCESELIDNKRDAVIKLYPKICFTGKELNINIISCIYDRIQQYKSISIMNEKYNNIGIIPSILDPFYTKPGTYTNKDYNIIDKCDEFQYKIIMSLRSNIELIHGSAGTGKSTVIFNIIAKRIPDDHIILCTAVQNQAIDALVQKLENSNSKFIVIGNSKDLGDTAKKYTSEEIYKTSPEINKIIKSLEKWNKFYQVLLSKPEDDWIEFLCKNHLQKLILKEPSYIKTYVLSQIEKLENEIEEIKKNIIKTARIFLCTIASIHKLPVNHIDTIIIDEAGSMTEMIMSTVLITNPLNLILIGDHKQLGGFTHAPDFITNEIKHNTSYLERALKNGRGYNMLKIQYRMSYDICNMVSRIFYNNMIISKFKKSTNSLKWFNIKGIELKDNSSYYNLEEIEFIKKIIPNDTKTMIITSYSKQFERLKYSIDNENISVKTIDSSQGTECDIVIVSLVRSNDFNKIGFLYDKKRLCVMLSRAIKELWIVGNYETFKNSPHKIWKSITSYFPIMNKNDVNTLLFSNKPLKTRNIINIDLNLD